MGKLVKQNTLMDLAIDKPDKTETWSGKHTARVTKSYNQPDGSILKVTRKINKDGTMSDKIERRHE